MKFLIKLERKREVWFLLSISFLFFLLRLPSFFEPLWYGDEGVYEVIGLALNQGKVLYRDIWDNKPPLLYLLYAIFHADQLIIRFVSFLFGLTAIILFYFLSKKLFIRQNICYGITSLFALLLGIPILEGNIANAENFILPFVLCAGLLIIHIAQKTKQTVHKNKNSSQYSLFTTNYFLLFLCGLLLGIAFLFKIVAVFDLVAFTLFIIYTHPLTFPIVWKKFQILFIGILPLFIGFFIPFFITIIFFLINHALLEYIHAAFLSNIGYVNYGNQFFLPFSNQSIPQGFLVFKLLLLGIFCSVLFVKRHKVSFTTQFILLWLTFSIFSALFSQRPYTHYLLVLLSSFCLFTGILLQKTKSQLLFVGVFLLITIYFLTNFSFYNKNIGYYKNFLSFMTGEEDIQTYRAFFDAKTPTDYMLAEYLHTRLEKNDQIFLWGNNAQLYVLAKRLPPGRYIVAYHITASKQTFTEMQTVLERTRPKFIVVMLNAGQFPYSLTGYNQRMNINNAVIYERSL